MEKGRPKWYEEEEAKLVKEWDTSFITDSLTQYVLSHASERYLAERARLLKIGKCYLNRKDAERSFEHRCRCESRKPETEEERKRAEEARKRYNEYKQKRKKE